MFMNLDNETQAKFDSHCAKLEDEENEIRYELEQRKRFNSLRTDSMSPTLRSIIKKPWVDRRRDPNGFAMEELARVEG
jgi:hypothetical protein